MFLLLAASAWAAPACDRNFTTEELLPAADAAEKAFAGMDAAAFHVNEVELRTRLVCVREVLSPVTIARVHRVEALASFLDKREDRTAASLAGMFAADPGHQVSSTLLPEAHPIRGKFSYAVTLMRTGGSGAGPALKQGWVEADGAHTTTLPTQRAALVQQLDGQGDVVATHYRWPDEAGFDWVVDLPAGPTAGATSLAKVQTPKSPQGKSRLPLLAGVGASLLASGAMFAVAAGTEADFEGRPVLGGEASSAEREAYEAELRGLQGTTNGLNVGAYAALGLGVALGVVTVVTW